MNNNSAYKEAMEFENIGEKYDMMASEMLDIADKSNDMWELVIAGFKLGYKRGVQASKHIINQQGPDRIELEKILDSLSPGDIKLVYMFAVGKTGYVLSS